MNRLLTPAETVFAHLCERGVCSVGVSWTVSGPVTPKLLCSALDHVSTFHPILRSEIVSVVDDGNNRKLAWVPAASGKPWYAFRALSSSSANTSLNILENSLLDRFAPKASPLARIWLVQNPDLAQKNSEIVLVVNHTLMTGRSTALFMDHVLHTMSSLLRGKQPALEERKEIQIQEEELRSLNQTAENDTFSVLPIYAQVLTKERRWGIQNTFISKFDPFVEKLKNACKLNNVSLNAALFACFLEAMDIECKKSNDTHCPFYKVASPVDLQGISGRQLGSSSVFTILSTIEKTKQMNFWDIARAYQRDLAEGLEGKKWLAPDPSVTKFFEPDLVDRSMYFSQGRVSSFTYSNLGDLNRVFDCNGKDFWSHPPFHIENMSISTNHHTLGSCFVVLVATFNGNLSITIGFPTPTYERTFMRKILDTAINIARMHSQQF